ncbi:serine/threonine protein kinase [Candidatus Bathyarchaeota archaeon]|nr:serine/threonine protein kinase [Candidatus Bathyarchaeota archaeon]
MADIAVPIDRLHNKRYGKVLCYPKFSAEELRSRIGELKNLGVKAIQFAGPKMACDLHVLGKGCVSIVVTALTETGKTALKIRRTDADRSSMTHETEMLKKANSINVGPTLLGATQNFILMELIEGPWLPDWITSIKGRGKAKRVRRTLRLLLEDCWKLDQIGLDHGELSRATKHVIVDPGDRPRIVDFETASIMRKPSNVTSICQYLFIGSHVARKIQRVHGLIQRENLIHNLRNYKKEPTLENFAKILSSCRLENI